VAPLIEEVGGRGGLGGARGGPAGEKGSALLEAAAAREEVRALQRVAKREKRGAVRELRLDRAFTVQESDRAFSERDGERAGVTKKLMSELQDLQATFNQQIGKRKSKPLARDDPARLPAHLAWKASREFGKTKADRRAIKSGVGGTASLGGGGEKKKQRRRESKGPHMN